MSLQKIPIPAIQKVQQHIRSALTLPASEQRLESWTSPGSLEEPPIPESLDDLGDLFKFGGPLTAEPELDESGYWSISTVNPAAALIQLPNLSLKPGWRWVTFLHRRKTGGISKTWAVPEDMGTTAQLELAIEGAGDRNQPPRPEGAVDDPLAVVTGDRSPMSFVIASVLQRELQAFGAIGADRTWQNHRPVAEIPAQVKWQWRSQAPKDIAPKVKVLPDGRAAVEFYTCRVKPPIVLYRHVDQYKADSYAANHSDKAMAMAQTKVKR
jgi:hypothetical protein